MPDDSIPKTLNAIKQLPSVDLLRELLAYDPETGTFRWKVRRRGTKGIGSIAGYRQPNGYRQITINGTLWLAHRLAWKVMTGKDPVSTIDHINHNTDDNSFANLREASMHQQSTYRTGHGSSKFLGVSWHKRSKVWSAKIRVNKKLRHIGSFTCEIKAARAYDAHASAAWGEFANLNFPEALWPTGHG